MTREHLDPDTGADGSSEFERRVGALLNDSADALDGRTRSALTRARYAALEHAGAAAAAPRRALRYWAPAGALAMGLLAVMFVVGQRAPGLRPALASGNASIEDLALLSDADAYGISTDAGSDADVEQDSDFYEWAVASAGASAGVDAGRGS